MITRERALAASSPLLPYVIVGLGLWAGAVVWNAWERRGEIAAWLKSTT